MDLKIFMVIILIIIIGLPVGLSIGIYSFIKKKKFEKKYRLIALIPILIVGYFVYDAFYPSEEFYIEDFAEVTGLAFPDNGEFIYKTATYPDQFGDYTSISIIKLDKKFYDSLSQHLSSKGFIEVNDRELISDNTLKKYSDGYVIRTFNRELPEKNLSVGFISDNKTVIIERVSW